MLAGQTVSCYYEAAKQKGQLWPERYVTTMTMDKKGNAKVTLQPMGGIVIKQL